MNLLDKCQELEYEKEMTLREIDRELFEVAVRYSISPRKYETRLMWLLSFHKRRNNEKN